MATALGRATSMIAVSPLKMSSSRCSRGMAPPGESVPCSIARREFPCCSTTPYPRTRVPGSMPRTRTSALYGRSADRSKLANAPHHRFLERGAREIAVGGGHEARDALQSVRVEPAAGGIAEEHVLPARGLAAQPREHARGQVAVVHHVAGEDD